MELIEIGNALKETREKKRISLDKISKQTKLPSAILEKLEKPDNKDVENIGNFYFKSFLKVYAKSLGQGDLIKDIDEAFKNEKSTKPKFDM